MNELLTRKECNIFKGSHFVPWVIRGNPMEKKKIKKVEKKEKEEKEEKLEKGCNKVVVFDLDETLGCFGDLYIIWCGLKHVLPSFDRFDELLDLYPEFLRHGMLTILEYLYNSKLSRECSKLYMYTNNQCSPSWVQMISHYLQNKIVSSNSSLCLFDQLIYAFKIQKKVVELRRTSHNKSCEDFLKCTLLSSDTEICFIDDTIHPLMKRSKVYYICPKPYVHSLSKHEIISRLVRATKQWYPATESLVSTTLFWSTWFAIHKRNLTREINPLELDLQISQKLIHHLREFILFGRTKANKETRKKTSRLINRITYRCRHSRLANNTKCSSGLSF